MHFDVKFNATEQSFTPSFGEVLNVSDGGFERGYAAGYDKGEKAGYADGHADGLAARAYETWTITLTDGTVVEKDVALV